MRAKEAKRLVKTASPTLESGWTNQPLLILPFGRVKSALWLFLSVWVLYV